MSTSLLGMTRDELMQAVAGHGLPAYTGDQLCHWLYRSDVNGWEGMTNISLKHRELLSSLFTTGLNAHAGVQVSADGTKKYLFPAQGNKFIETAFIPEEKRSTLCVSVQVGCKMGCLFCMTARQGFRGDLTAGEIINQLRSLPEHQAVTNVVYMGMGEPFDNTGEVMRSLGILTAAWGFGMSHRRITVSTIGVVPGMEVFLRDSRCHLAVSLHSPFDDERRRLMPVQHVYPIREVIDVIRKNDIGKYRRVSFEYILFRGVNDSQRHVKELARLLNPLRCRINLMRFHPIPESPLEGADEDTIRAFQKGLNEKGIIATIRQSRGQDIDAACGLLSKKRLN